jgi:hypothetical protein
MSVTLNIAGEEFHRAAEQCIRHSERTYDQFINGQALAVASRAIKETEKANADRIAYELAGNVSTKIGTNRKTGKRTTRRQIDVLETSLAARIVNARLVARGEKPIFGRELVKVARRMIGARIKATSFIRSGWIYAVRTLASAVGYSAGARDGARMTGQAKGYANPARPAVNSVVSPLRSRTLRFCRISARRSLSLNADCPPRCRLSQKTCSTIWRRNCSPCLRRSSAK